MRLEKLFKDLSDSLFARNIPYIVVGGQAALLYREPRFTNDIDIILGLDYKQLDLVIELCKKTDITILTQNPYEFVQETMVLPAIDKESKTRIDFIFSNTQYEKEAISRANRVELYGTQISFCSLEDIIILKVFAGRPRDIEDVKAIIKKNPKYDRNLIIKNLKSLGQLLDHDLVKVFESIERKDR